MEEPWRDEITQVVRLNPVLPETIRGDRQAVLVVEDDRTTLNWVCEYLKVIGVGEILSAPDSEMGLQLLAAHADRIGLVIVDMYLPGMNGAAMCAAFHHEMSTASLSVVGITAGSLMSVVEAARAARMHYLVSKPCSPGCL